MHAKALRIRAYPAAERRKVCQVLLDAWQPRVTIDSYVSLVTLLNRASSARRARRHIMMSVIWFGSTFVRVPPCLVRGSACCWVWCAGWWLVLKANKMPHGLTVSGLGTRTRTYTAVTRVRRAHSRLGTRRIRHLGAGSQARGVVFVSREQVLVRNRGEGRHAPA